MNGHVHVKIKKNTIVKVFIEKKKERKCSNVNTYISKKEKYMHKLKEVVLKILCLTVLAQYFLYQFQDVSLLLSK